MLQDPQVANYLNGTWAARGKTVKELVRNMTSSGLFFAPEVTEDQIPAYVALQRALANFSQAVNPQTTQVKTVAEG